MKLQGFGIVFALICVPLILVLSYYISLQIDTITLQNKYDSHLLDATYDAMSSFELNTANEDLSSVSDSLRTIIDASNNILFNTLATNLGMSNASKTLLEPNLPAVLYTLYDGYYIYSPTYSPTVVTDSDGNAVKVGDLGVQMTTSGRYTFTDPKMNTQYQTWVDETSKGNNTNNGLKLEYERSNTITYQQLKAEEDNGYNVTDYGQLLYTTEDTVKNPADGSYTNCTPSTDPGNAKYNTKNILKTYVPYSARYVQSGLTDSEGTTFDADINVIYTLDNYVTIEGNFKYGPSFTDDVYYSKSGYLLPFISTADEADPTKKNVKLSVKIELPGIAGSNENTIYNYNQNEIQTYIENGNPIRISVLKDLDGTDYENVIEIDNTNSAVIDNTYTNEFSDTVIVSRYNNYVSNAEEYSARVNQNISSPCTDPGMYYGLYILRDDSGMYQRFVVSGISQFLEDIFNNPDLNSIGDINAARTMYSGDANGVYCISKDNLNEMLNLIINGLRTEINKREYNMQLNSAAVYYTKAAIFSKWVAENLSEITSNSIKEISGLSYTTIREMEVGEATGDELNYLKIWDSNDRVFDFTTGSKQEGVAPIEIKKDSPFYTHKLNVIRTSIQYNLNLAMSAYNRHFFYNDDDELFQDNDNADHQANRNKRIQNVNYAMPVMSDSEWDQILNNISIVSFMQGLQCGLKTYNNYVIVSSTNNEVMVTPENIYYAKINEFNDEVSEYHKYNCEDMVEEDNFYNGSETNIRNAEKYISFTSKEVKYDKLSVVSDILPYRYDHKNVACYDCINDGNYSGINIFDINLKDKNNKLFNDYLNIRRAYYIGIAKERNDVYKMNAVRNSEGYEIIYNSTTDSAPYSYNNNLAVSSSRLALNKIKQIEIVFSAVDINRRDETSLVCTVRYNGNPLNTNADGSIMSYSIPTNNENYYTWKLQVDPNITDGNKFSIGKLLFENANPTSSFLTDADIAAGITTDRKLKNSIQLVRVVYK